MKFDEIMDSEKLNMENDELKKSSELQKNETSLSESVQKEFSSASEKETDNTVASSKEQAKETVANSEKMATNATNVSDANDKVEEKALTENEDIDETTLPQVSTTNRRTESVAINPTDTKKEEIVSEEKGAEETAVAQINQVMQEVEETEQDDNAQEDTQSIAWGNLSKQELTEKMQALLDKPVLSVKQQVDAIKQHFYRKSKLETDQQRTEYIENGGSEMDFIPAPTELESEFKELLDKYKEQRAKHIAEQEEEKEKNLLQKQHIIQQITQLVETKEDVSSNINTFKQLQQEWKAIGAVPANVNNELWKEYNQQQEAFWDLIKINNELREYDFKKNLKAKTKLCEIAEELDKEEDVITAFRELQKLHDKWRELGPVARELREDLWQRFKEASTVINKKHQSHFSEIREVEVENLTKKEALCERIETINTDELNSYKEWEETTKKVLEIQEEWRSIGFAPRKQNKKIFERYRKACDDFFNAKAEFYKGVKAGLNENLEKKKELCEQAEAIKDSTNWKTTTDKFIKLQKEWKMIGPVPRKQSDDVWKRFIKACDYFFEQRNKELYGHKIEEQNNLTKKKELIEKIKNFEKKEDSSESLTALRGLAAEWNAIGHVPYKEKDKIYKAYKTALDEQFDALDIDKSQRRLETFKSNLSDMSDKGENKLYRERDKLMRTHEHLKSEIATYENNIGFFSVSSKKGGGMLAEMQRKIDTLKQECKLIEKKINLIDDKL